MEAMTTWGIEGLVVMAWICQVWGDIGLATRYKKVENIGLELVEWKLETSHTSVFVRLHCEDMHMNNIQGGNVFGGQLGAEDQSELCQVEHDFCLWILKTLRYNFQKRY